MKLVPKKLIKLVLIEENTRTPPKVLETALDVPSYEKSFFVEPKSSAAQDTP